MEETREPTESEKLHTYVRLKFEQLGFNYMQADTLAEDRADWWEAKRLIDQGCPVMLAFDILSE